MKQWPGVKIREAPAFVRPAVAESDEKPTEAQDSADGEVMTHSTLSIHTKNAAAVIKPIDDRESLRALIEREVPVASGWNQPKPAEVPQLVVFDSAVYFCDVEFELWHIEASLQNLEHVLAGNVDFSSAVNSYMAIPQQSSSLAEAILALERSVVFCDHGSAKELLHRVKTTRAIARRETKSADITAAPRESLTGLAEAVEEVLHVSHYLCYIRDRLATRAPLSSAAKQNYSTINEAARAVELSCKITRHLSASVRQLDEICTSNDTSFHATADELRRRWRAVLAAEAR